MNDRQRRRRWAASYVLSLVLHGLVFLLFVFASIDLVGSGSVDVVSPAGVTVYREEAPRSSEPAPKPSTESVAATRVEQKPSATASLVAARPASAKRDRAPNVRLAAVRPFGGRPGLTAPQPELARNVRGAEPQARAVPSVFTPLPRPFSPAPSSAPSNVEAAVPVPTAVPTVASGARAEPTAATLPAAAGAISIASPSEDSTSQPTAAPSTAPTVAPQPVRTSEPAARPVRAFTAVPAVAATSDATAAPTAQATAEPTAAPTRRATTEPTAAPTQQATAEPTATPTQQATVEPTAAPTQQATVEPTAAPTQKATAEPKVAPIQRTAPPTPAATHIPTPEPTTVATLKPTAISSAVPTVAPSTVARAAPSRAPTPVSMQQSTAQPIAKPRATTPSMRPVGRETPALQAGPQVSSVVPLHQPSAGRAGTGAAASRPAENERHSGADGSQPPLVQPSVGGQSPAAGVHRETPTESLNDRLKHLDLGGDVDYTPKRVAIGDVQQILDDAMAAYELRLAPSADILSRTFGFIYERRSAGHPDSIAYVYDTYSIGPIRMCKAWKIVEHPSQPVREVGAVAGSAGIGGAVASNANSANVRHDNGGAPEAQTVQFPCTEKSYTAVRRGSLTAPLPRHPDLNPSRAPGPSSQPMPAASLAP